MSLPEFETLLHFKKLERKHIVQSLDLAVLKTPYAGYLLTGNRSNFIVYEGNILWYYTCTKKFHHSNSLTQTKIKVIFSLHTLH